MRRTIEAIGAVIAIAVATAFIWLVLSGPGFLVDDASTVPLAAHQEAQR